MNCRKCGAEISESDIASAFAQRGGRAPHVWSDAERARRSVAMKEMRRRQIEQAREKDAEQEGEE